MRLLVAEDHPTLARSLADGLREEGYAVDLTFDGEEALHLATVTQYDGIVLDMMLPKRDGWAILSTLRKAGSKTPVLCLTAREGVGDRVRGLDLGADDYLIKPFNWDELLARVRAIVRRGHGQKASTITIEDLEIDLVKKTVKRADQSIELSAREFSLLEYLAHRQGHVVSRTDIWEHLYDQHDEATSNVVDVYIGYLRNKIDKLHNRKLIQTRRGLGYVLGVES